MPGSLQNSSSNPNLYTPGSSLPWPHSTISSQQMLKFPYPKPVPQLPVRSPSNPVLPQSPFPCFQLPASRVDVHTLTQPTRQAVRWVIASARSAVMHTKPLTTSVGE
jgi:hypothetical protein